MAANLTTQVKGQSEDNKTTHNESRSDSDTVPVIIDPDESERLDSDDEHELEFCDALNSHGDSTIKDELTDIKDKTSQHVKLKEAEGSSFDPSLRGNDEFEDFYEDAENHETLANESNDEKDKSNKDEKIKRRQEEEDRLTDNAKQELRSEALNKKTSANKLYVENQLNEALELYTEALNICPLCFREDRAILFANRAAAKLKLDEKDGAIEDCSEAIDLNPNYLKAILRRAQIYEDTDRPHESMKDFEKILELDPRHIEAIVAVRRLPEKIKEKDEKMKAEMMDNLKKLGNMCLKPFGLSTNNFQFDQDPNTGGYSVNFKK